VNTTMVMPMKVTPVMIRRRASQRPIGPHEASCERAGCRVAATRSCHPGSGAL
jgi:hypothetical protein